MAFTGSSVLVLNNTNTNVQFTANASTPFSVPVSAGSTGIWKYIVSRAGYTKSYGTFDVTGGGLDTAAISQAVLTQPSGAALYTSSTSSIINIVFAEDRCNIDISDGTVTPQEIIDEIENALITEDGCRFLALTQGSQSSFAVLGGQSYLLLGKNYRLRRANSGDVNATVEGFAISADGQPIDGVNGSVAYLSSVTIQPQTIRDAMALALSSGVTAAEGSIDKMPESVRTEMEKTGGVLLDTLQAVQGLPTVDLTGLNGDVSALAGDVTGLVQMSADIVNFSEDAAKYAKQASVQSA